MTPALFALMLAAPPTAPVLPVAVMELLPAPAEPLTDPLKLAERIEASTKAAADKLAGQDPGAAARNAQRQALRDIDELLKQVQNQPPPPMPMSGGGGGGGQGGSPLPPAGGQPPLPDGQPPKPMGGQPPPPGGQRPQGGEPMPPGQPMPMGGQPMPPAGATPGNAQSGQAKAAQPPDDPVTKQVWGHLPDSLRKQMSQYYREQFMPRYSGLLKDYFAALAEQDKGAKK
jgi:hypothetical protein